MLDVIQRRLGLARATGLRGVGRKSFPAWLWEELLPMEHLWISEAIREHYWGYNQKGGGPRNSCSKLNRYLSTESYINGKRNS